MDPRTHLQRFVAIILLIGATLYFIGAIGRVILDFSVPYRVIA